MWNYTIGIDPSFRRTGITIIDNAKVTICDVKMKLPEKKTFEAMYDCTMDIIQEVTAQTVSHTNSPETMIAIEIPPPLGQFASGLWMLDSLLIFALQHHGYPEIQTFPPNKIKSLHGSRKATKTDSVKLVEEILNLNQDFEVFIEGRLNHDQAESAMFAIMIHNAIPTNELKFVLPKRLDPKKWKVPELDAKEVKAPS